MVFQREKSEYHCFSLIYKWKMKIISWRIKFFETRENMNEWMCITQFVEQRSKEDTNINNFPMLMRQNLIRFSCLIGCIYFKRRLCQGLRNAQDKWIDVFQKVLLWNEFLFSNWVIDDLFIFEGFLHTLASHASPLLCSNMRSHQLPYLRAAFPLVPLLLLW